MRANWAILQKSLHAKKDKVQMKIENINILVTGCGGDIGQSVGKILVELTSQDKLWGCDISEKNAAQFIYKNFFLIIPCSHNDYLSNLEKEIIDKKIDLLIPISEPELRFFSDRKITQVGKAKLLCASFSALQIGFDKLKTAEFLKESNLPYPKTYDVSKVQSPQEFPVILKSKTGSGSKSIYLVEDQESYEFYKKRNSDFIVQEFLSKENGEFTCGLYRGKSGVTRAIIFKRELLGGFSGYGEVIENDDISNLLKHIAENIGLIGSINVQLRLTAKGPVVFEINPRFSSTVRFRDLLGFKDILWSIEDILDIPISDYNHDNLNKKFYKGFSEYIN